MCQELGLGRQTGTFSLSDGLVQTDGIPVNDDGRQQIEPSHPVVLARRCSSSRPSRGTADGDFMRVSVVSVKALPAVFSGAFLAIFK